ncbi:MAG: hypothetical protein ACXVZQ_02925, partial [Terriglobales bacterium]
MRRDYMRLLASFKLPLAQEPFHVSRQLVFCCGWLADSNLTTLNKEVNNPADTGMSSLALHVLAFRSEVVSQASGARAQFVLARRRQHEVATHAGIPTDRGDIDVGANFPRNDPGKR